MDETLPLQIPVSCLTDFFTCSICMNHMNETSLTPCGHRYCRKCITEWVDRKHTCPCCTKCVNANQLIKDHQFDSLIDSVTKETLKAETQYFESLINDSMSQEHKELTPTHAVLKDHLMNVFAAHERYFQNLKKDFDEQKKQVAEMCDTAIMDLKTHELTPEEIDQQTQDLKETLQRKTKSLDKEFQHCTELIVDAFKTFLNTKNPDLHILPVKVNINVLSRGMTISSVQFRPEDVLKSKVMTAVEATMKAKNDPVQEWPDKLHFIVFGPSAKKSAMEMQQAVKDILQEGKTFHNVKVIDGDEKPVLQHSMKPGSEIVVYGDVKLKSDLPKQCFAKTFNKDQPESVDYFECKQCSFKWICRSCMEVCHQDHEVTPYVMNHNPAWACCYCPKKKTCRISQN